MIVHLHLNIYVYTFIFIQMYGHTYCGNRDCGQNRNRGYQLQPMHHEYIYRVLFGG